ncbi:MAG: hypothetical protein Q7T21_11495, partial [Gallionella sp.]|nr:hypothetical protein [Gallionella sp.]
MKPFSCFCELSPFGEMPAYPISCLSWTSFFPRSNYLSRISTVGCGEARTASFALMMRFVPHHILRRWFFGLSEQMLDVFALFLKLLQR